MDTILVRTKHPNIPCPICGGMVDLTMPETYCPHLCGEVEVVVTDGSEWYRAKFVQLCGDDVWDHIL